MDQGLFERLCTEVRECARFACENQSRIHLSFKTDGSILTETDLAISDRIVSLIRTLAPQCNIVSEECATQGFDTCAPYTFILDPIDGTDSYSQGIGTWCVSLGILDKSLRPCGAIICAPHFGLSSEGLFITTFPGSDTVLVNGAKAQSYSHNPVPLQLALGSDTLKHLDLSPYKGKIRSYGSSIIHLLCPCIFFNIDACIDPVCYPWDIASSHAVLLKLGQTIRYRDGGEVVYTPQMLENRQKLRTDIYSGGKDAVNWLLENLRPLV